MSPTKTYNLCLLGFGNVGRALARLLVEKREEMRDTYAVEWRVTGVATRRMGWLAAPEGFDDAELLSGEPRPRSGVAPTNDVGAWLDAARCDVLFENTSLDVRAGEPARSHIRAALERGAHAVTANKGPVVHAFEELDTLARSRGRRFMFESAVADCMPVFSLFRSSLPAARLLSVRGLLNATSSVILEAVEEGATFDEGVARAQRLGFAETDPSNDVDGWDAAVKICSLANVLMGARLKLADVRREGIRHLGAEEVHAAKRAGAPLRIVAHARRGPDGAVSASVGPEPLAPDDPFSKLPGSSLAVRFELDVLAGLTLIEDGADNRSTAYGCLADFLNAVRET
jgi:homoserine dehydrogenase